MIIYAGYKAGKNWEALTAVLKQYNQIVLFILIVVLAGFIVRWFMKKSRTH
jgi:membrane protein DedA with SNARE-associated domain